MMLIDTHSHLYLDAFDSDREPVIQRAKDAGVRLMLLPNVDASTIKSLKDLCAAHPSHCLPMMGLHPCSVTDLYQEELEDIRQELFTSPYIAVGEIGIDMYWDKTHKAQQQLAFDLQLQWAMELDLPVVIHMRDSYAEIMEVMAWKARPGLRGVFHCFTGTLEQAREITAMGFHLGIGGVLSYKNSTLPIVLKDIDPEWIVLETDSPYLPPVPHRGKRNESAYLLHLLPLLSQIWSLSEEEAALITSRNAIKLFNLNTILH